MVGATRAMCGPVIRCTILKMNSKTIRQHEKQRTNKCQKRHADTIHGVSTFLQSEAVPLPDKKLMSWKTGLAKSVLQKPLHKKYKETDKHRSTCLPAAACPEDGLLSLASVPL